MSTTTNGSLLGFLVGAKFDPSEAPVRRSGGGARKQWNPLSGLVVRLWKDGSVYPSQALVDKFNLEYAPVVITKGENRPYSQEEIDKHNENQLREHDEYLSKLAQGQPDEWKPKELKPRFKPSNIVPKEGAKHGNGFDVIDSRVWAGYKASGNMLFISPASQDLPKVDLFGQTKYTSAEEEGAVVYDAVPVSSVMDQGSKTFGEDVLIPAVKEIYGIELTDDNEFVDLVVVEELKEDGQSINLKELFSQKVAHLPKRVLRGEDKGKADYVRREHAIVYGFIPAQLLPKSATEVAQGPGANETVAQEETTTA